MDRPIPLRRPMPTARRPERAGFNISTLEVFYILISIVTLYLAFTYFFKISDQGILVGVFFGILVHELSHKFVAQSMGFKSEYKIWEIGLVLVLALAFITKGRVIFAAPGFVVTEGLASVRERGIISFSAPFSNIMLALVFLAISAPWSTSAAYVNILLGIFNLLPLDPLDGNKVMAWSQGIWTGSFVFAILLGLGFFL
jgi:Zn-dependent protease